jgi:uncharacterized metal-binding protein
MTRELKALGMALAAALALGAVAASGASAEPAKFTAEVGAGETAKIHGDQIGTNVLTVGGKEMTCATATLTGEALTKGPESTEVTLTPKYETCHTIVTILGFKVTRTATVTMNGCAYVFSATKETAGTPFSADLTIECPTTVEPHKQHQIEIHVYKNSAHEHNKEVLCTYDIGHQTIKDAIELTNTPEHDIVAHINAAVATTNTIQNATCGNEANPTWILTGEDTLTATGEAGESVGATVS